MNKERWETSSPPNCKTMVMGTNMQTNRLRMQKMSRKSLGLPNCRTMVMATNMWTYKLGMQKKGKKSLCYFNALLIVVSMNPSSSFLQHNTNMVMVTTKETYKPHIRWKQGERKEELGELQPSWLLLTFTFCLCSCNNMKVMVMAKQMYKQARTQKQGEGKRSWDGSHPLDYCQTSCALLPMNKHTQSNVVLEPSLLVPML